MSMSDDVAGAALQVSMKAAEKSIELGGRAVESTVNNIARLLRFLGNTISHIHSTNLNNISPGAVSMQRLIRSARQNGDTLSTSENAFSACDVRTLSRMARHYGIPIAFTGEKENNYANVRTSDLPIFKQMCTQMMKEKISERPQELGNFKVNKWEIPFLTNEFNNYDLSAQFGVTKDGENFCLYEKADEKAIMIARNEFTKKCRELNENMTVEKQDNFYVISDKNSGNKISFEDIPSRAELSEQIQKNFGYEKNKADIACAKFGQENLKGEEKSRFFGNNPQNDFSKIDRNITVKGESILTKPYTCWRITPKSDSVPRIVFQNENGNFAILNPEKMTRKNMAKVLNEQFKIGDIKTTDALIDKAEKICDFYAKQDSKNFSHRVEFDETEIIRKYSESLQLMPKSVETSIERNDKNNFTIKADFTGTDNTDTQELLLSFSDKKNSLNQLAELYKKQGVPEDIAKQMAKEIFEKAESQSAEKVLHIEEIRSEKTAEKNDFKMVVSSGNRSEEFDITDTEKAVSEISEKFEIPEETAIIVVEKAQEDIEEHFDEEKISDTNIEETQLDSEKISPVSNLNFNNSDVPETPGIPPEMPNFGGNFAGDVDIPDIPQTPELPKIDVPVGRGVR